MARRRRAGCVGASALVVALAALALAPSAAAQDAGALRERAERHLDAAAADPAGYAGEAATPEWQRREFNFTVGWTCDAADGSPARGPLEGLGLCPVLRDVTAGEERAGDEGAAEATEADGPANETVAEAEELEDDARRALEDGAAAAAALVDDVASDPAGAAAAAERFLRRLGAVLERLAGGLLGGVMAGAGALADGFVRSLDALGRIHLHVGDGTLRATSATGDGLAAATMTTADGLATAAQSAVGAAADTARTVGDGVAALVDDARDALRGLVSGGGARRDAAPSASDATRAPDDVRDLADGALDALPL